MSLKLPQIDFDMPITDLIMELEKMRYMILKSDTHPLVFQQIRQLFQMLESIGSSRIEGNNTTIMDYVESTKIQSYPDLFSPEEDIKETITKLTDEMLEAASKMEFERAAELRDKIKELENLK